MHGWETLLQAGLPDGAARPPPARAPAREQLRLAVEELTAGPLDRRSAEILAAWLGALRAHFPTAFGEIAGLDGPARLERLRREVDPDRYLKLRRIAVANLAAIF